MRHKMRPSIYTPIFVEEQVYIYQVICGIMKSRDEGKAPHFYFFAIRKI